MKTEPPACPVCQGDCSSANPPVIFCPMQPDPRGFTEWKHEPDEFDRAADEDARRDALDDADDDDLEAWLSDR